MSQQSRQFAAEILTSLINNDNEAWQAAMLLVSPDNQPPDNNEWAVDLIMDMVHYSVTTTKMLSIVTGHPPDHVIKIVERAIDREIAKEETDQ